MLGDFEYFVKGLEKCKDEEFVKKLHSLMFGSAGKKAETKENILQFNGFAEGTSKEDKIAEVTKNKKKWTDQALKKSLGLFRLEKSGTREELIVRLVEFLMRPIVAEDVSILTSDKSAEATKKKKKKKLSKKKKTKGSKRVPPKISLHVAAERGDTEVVSTLLDQLADIEKRDKVRASLINMLDYVPLSQLLTVIDLTGLAFFYYRRAKHRFTLLHLEAMQRLYLYYLRMERTLKSHPGIQIKPRKKVAMDKQLCTMPHTEDMQRL